MERFFSTVKSELADRFASFSEAKMELFDHIEVFDKPTAPAFDARPDQSGGLRTTRSGRVMFTVGRLVGSCSPATTTTGTPPSARRLSSSIALT